jgi:predicted nucleic acid-binding protein
MVFIDSNIFMYAAGTDSPHKVPSLLFLHRVAAGSENACTSIEVLQEILHRYRFIDRWEQGKKVYNLAKKIVPRILPVDVSIIDKAYKLMDRYSSIYARDAVHASTCLINGIGEIISFDSDFDVIEGIKRIHLS